MSATLGVEMTKAAVDGDRCGDGGGGDSGVGRDGGGDDCASGGDEGGGVCGGSGAGGGDEGQCKRSNIVSSCCTSAQSVLAPY